MKNLGVILVAAVTLPLLLLLGFFMLWPQDRPPQPAIIIAIDDDVARFEATLTASETPYLEQLNQLTGTLQARQTSFSDQTDDWQTSQAQAQSQLNILIVQEQNLQAEITQLKATQTETLTAHQNQLERLTQQYQAQILQLENQLEAEKSQLAELNARLQSP